MAAGDKYINRSRRNLSTEGLLRSLVRQDANGNPFLKTNFVPVTLDVDTLAFINAAGITDETQINVVEFLVTSLKGTNTSYNPTALDCWTNLLTFYPFIGGTATAHKFNLKDPRDLDAAFRIVWSGGLTHSTLGVQGNATNGLGNTKLNPSLHLNINSYSWGRYINLVPPHTHGTNYSNGAFATAGGNKGVHEFLTHFNGPLDAKLVHLTSGQESPGRIFGNTGATYIPVLSNIISRRSSTTLHQGYKNGVSFIQGQEAIFNPVTGVVSLLPNADFLICGVSIDAGAPGFYNDFRFCTLWHASFSDEPRCLVVSAIIAQAQFLLGRNF